MSVNGWPMRLDWTRDKCRRLLREKQIKAYAYIVDALRGHGDLTSEKKSLLEDLQTQLSISPERHRAEVRRAVNDETLWTIAENIAGPNSGSEWQMEGRRLVPIMPRLVPQTAFTSTADHAANQQSEKNMALPPPDQTAVFMKEPPVSLTTSPLSATKSNSRPGSPTSNVVVLPSGMSITIKGGLETEDEPVVGPKRRRLDSYEYGGHDTPVSSKPFSNTSSGPMRITVSKSPTAQPTNQKVIFVSSAGKVERTTLGGRSQTYTVSAGSSRPVESARAVTSSVRAVTSHSPEYHSMAHDGPANPSGNLLHSTLSGVRPRPKFNSPVSSRTVTSYVPGGTRALGPSVYAKPANKPTIQIRQEGSMKIITQSASGGQSRLLPKPSPVSGGVNVLPMTTYSSSVNLSKVTTSVPGGGRVLTMPAHCVTRTVTSSVITKPNVVTVNPKTIQLKTGSSASVLGRGGAQSSGKPNVIVVQKATPKRAGTPTIQIQRQANVDGSGFQKELVSYIHNRDSSPPSRPAYKTAKVVERRIPQKPAKPELPGALPPELAKIQALHGIPMGREPKASLLSDLMHVPEGTVQDPAIETEDGQWIEQPAEIVGEYVEEPTAHLPEDEATAVEYTEAVLHDEDAAQPQTVQIRFASPPSGKLDPQTGVFYNQDQKLQVDAQSGDILSNALSEAQIELSAGEFQSDPHSIAAGQVQNQTTYGSSEILQGNSHDVTETGESLAMETVGSLKSVDTNVLPQQQVFVPDVPVMERIQKKVVPPEPSLPHWTRAAHGLLNRVAKFRNSSDLPPSTWFLHPVDAREVPDYYQVVGKPMDLSTMRRKLEMQTYQSLADFDRDMQLIRANCYLYNPAGHQIRQDCDDLFGFYDNEYSKVSLMYLKDETT